MKHSDFTSSANRIQNTACSREHQGMKYLKNKMKGQVISFFFFFTDFKFHKGGPQVFVKDNMSWLLLLFILSTVKCLILVLQQLTLTNRSSREKKERKNPQKTTELPSIYEADWGPKEATSDKGDILSLRGKSSGCTSSLTLQSSSHWSTSKYQNKEFINCCKVTVLFYSTRSTRHNNSWNVLNQPHIF